METVFKLILANIEPTMAHSEALYARCDDATLAVRCGVPYVEFEREADHAEDAIQSAIEDVLTALPSVRIVRIEPDDYVSESDIARRAGITRQAVHNYFTGARGKAFPHPIAGLSSKSPAWSWAEVCAWLLEAGHTTADDTSKARYIARINQRIQENAHGFGGVKPQEAKRISVKSVTRLKHKS